LVEQSDGLIIFLLLHEGEARLVMALATSVIRAEDLRRGEHFAEGLFGAIEVGLIEIVSAEVVESLCGFGVIGAEGAAAKVEGFVHQGERFGICAFAAEDAGEVIEAGGEGARVGNRAGAEDGDGFAVELFGLG
jgi:hypothetical protein